MIVINFDMAQLPAHIFWHLRSFSEQAGGGVAGLCLFMPNIEGVMCGQAHKG